tara:strand:+ start:5362 stop:6372 length:1011 start_codon:yes stop_codon:yes gene_type:complete
LIGRLLRFSEPLERDYETHRIKLLFNKGFLFYAEFNFRLFFWLLLKKSSVYHSNDLDTLLAMWIVAKIKRKPIVYDSHEYFTGVPEIKNRPFVKRFWEGIESKIFPKLKYVFTVNKSISNLYYESYGIRPKVLRNLPLKKAIKKTKSREELGLPLNKKVVILQGAGINVDRGAEELLEAISIQNNFFLCIVGKGDVVQDLKKRAQSPDLINKVIFIDSLPYQQMMEYTLNSDVGVSLDKSSNLNYLYSLPNKIFDYFKAEIPVVSSDLIEINKIINGFNAGLLIENHQPKSILKALTHILDDKNYKTYKKFASKVIDQLNWETESQVLVNCYNKIE